MPAVEVRAGIEVPWEVLTCAAHRPCLDVAGSAEAFSEGMVAVGSPDFHMSCVNARLLSVEAKTWISSQERERERRAMWSHFGSSLLPPLVLRDRGRPGAAPEPRGG